MPPKTQPGLAPNPRQRQAIEHDEGPLLVVAGAGTGKTRVITERIRRLLETNTRLSGESILGLTFTNKAAAEMKHRLMQAAGERGGGVWLGTFHSFCLNVVLERGGPPPRVFEKIDHWILLRRNLRELALERYAKLHDPGHILNDFLDFFSRCQDELITPDDYDCYVDRLAAALEAARPQLSPDDAAEREDELERQREIARAYRVSDRLLREQGALSFGSQILEAVRRLQGDPALAAALGERFRYILVDEFQDTNIAQIELLRLLAGKHRNLFVVGDDDQAIYRFRGASFASFKRFAEFFLAADSRAHPGVALVENYRSTKRVLRVAAEVIAQNRDRYLRDKRLETQNPEGERIRVAEFACAREEAHWIAGEIARLHAAGQRWDRMAVLYRQHNHRDALVRALTLKGTPFVIRGLSILSCTLIRDLIAYLRLIVSPADNVSCARVLAAPYWGFAPEHLVRLAQRGDRGRRSLLDELRGSLDLPPDVERGRELVRWLGGLSRLAYDLPASAVAATLVEGLGLDLLPAGADRLYLERFLGYLREWEARSDPKSLAAFVEHLGYLFEAGETIPLEEQQAGDAVQLMTVHGAKGLEFDHVFVLRLTKGAFPPRKRTPVIEFPAELMKEAPPEGDFQIQEERRLFYVALTRARRRLTLTAVVGPRSPASVFLGDFLSHPEIQARDVERLAPKVDLPREALEMASRPADPASPLLIDPARENSRAWSRIALWAAAYRPPLPQPLVLSATGIDTYANCPQKYLFEQVWRLRGGPQAAMSFGNAIHATIREFVAGLRRGLPMPLEELEAVYRREWPAGGYRDPFQEEEYRKAGEGQLRAFHARYLALQPPVLHQEKRFELPLEHDIVVKGRIDQVNRLAGGAAEVVDYKTGAPKNQKQADENLQLGIYAIAARDALDLDPQRLTLWYLKTDQRVETSRGQPALDETRQKVIEIAGQIRAGQFDPKPGYLCRYCEFQPLCPAYEDLVPVQPAAVEVPATEPAAPASS
ncbi:MAG TPA: ATP-dependent DNA helicase [Candidatus Acidoferrales bacterium]|nr:ATP-dependent DNA helicase [Candidatus Acidoferrales bacterium]